MIGTTYASAPVGASKSIDRGTAQGITVGVGTVGAIAGGVAGFKIAGGVSSSVREFWTVGQEFGHYLSRGSVALLGAGAVGIAAAALAATLLKD